MVLNVTTGACETQFVYNSHDFEKAIHLMINHCIMNYHVKAIMSRILDPGIPPFWNSDVPTIYTLTMKNHQNTSVLQILVKSAAAALGHCSRTDWPLLKAFFAPYFSGMLDNCFSALSISMLAIFINSLDSTKRSGPSISY